MLEANVFHMNRINLNMTINSIVHLLKIVCYFCSYVFEKYYPMKNIALKLDHIKFDKYMWSTMMKYKNTFDHFDFYLSFIVNENASINMEDLLADNDFDFHFEGRDSLHRHDYFVHIYSLPFAFKFVIFISHQLISIRLFHLNLSQNACHISFRFIVTTYVFVRKKKQ